MHYALLHDLYLGAEAGAWAVRRVCGTEECLLGSNAAVGHDKMGN